MNSSGLRIATIRGIPIRIHITFLLVLPLLAFAFRRAFIEAAHYADVPPEQLTGSPWLWGFGVAIALFLSVLLHELAHSLYALRKGGRVQDITLLMIGGVSRIEQPPKKLRQEAVMALVGPLVSIALGGLLYLLYTLSSRLSFNLRFALFYLGGLNVFLGVFNLLPAFPMDGGRILRAVLAERMGPVRATHIASRVGKMFAVAFGIWGFLSFNMLLVVIAFFVFVGAESETRAVMVKALLGRLRVHEVMTSELPLLLPDVTVHEAAERMLRERQLAFAVPLEDQRVGMLTLEAVQAVPPERRTELLARDIAVTVTPLSPDDDASRAFRIMSETDAPQVPVAESGRLVGTVSREDVARELKLTELESSQRAFAWPSWRRGARTV